MIKDHGVKVQENCSIIKSVIPYLKVDILAKWICSLAIFINLQQLMYHFIKMKITAGKVKRISWNLLLKITPNIHFFVVEVYKRVKKCVGHHTSAQHI